jgi:hypothetical protein
MRHVQLYLSDNMCTLSPVIFNMFIVNNYWRIMRVWYGFLVFISIVFKAQLAYPQWVQTNGPGWGMIYCIASSGNNLITNSSEGVFFSTNNGTNWKQVNDGLPNSGIHSFIFNGNNIYAGTLNGIFLSTDNGTDWIQMNSGLIDTSVNVLATNGDYIFAGTVSGGVFISTNNGTSWAESNDGISNYKINCFAVSGNDIYAGSDDGVVYHSTNNGTDWTLVNSGLSKVKKVSALAICGSIIFADESGIVYSSSDNGANWSETNLVQVSLSVDYLTVSGTTIFAGSHGTPGGGDVYRSTNYGTDWERVMGKNSVIGLTSSGNNIYASVYGNEDFSKAMGLFLSTNNGTDWTEIGLPLSAVFSISIIGSEIYAGTYFTGLFRSDFKDGTEMTMSGLYTKSVHSIIVSGGNIFAGTAGTSHPFGGVYRSTDNGTNWSYVSIGVDYIRIYAMAANGPNIFAGTNSNNTGGIFVSTDYGTTWNLSNNGLTNKDIWFLTVSGDNIFAGTRGGVFLSTNNGTNWTQENYGLTDTTVYCLAVNGDNIFAGTPSGVFRSTNNGSEWTQMNTGLINTNVRSFALSGGNIFIGTYGGGVYGSTDNGALWTQSGLDSQQVISLAANESYIIAGTNGAGIWYCPLSELVLPVELVSFTGNEDKGNILLKWNTATELGNMGFDIERAVSKSDWEKIGFVKGNGNSNSTKNYVYADKSVSKAGKYFYRLKQIDNNGSYKYSSIAEVEFGAPGSYALNQNYPNPFNPSTKISYLLKDKGFVNLKVYGIKGELVKVLVNELKEAGYYESEFDGKGLASGVYIYRLEVIGDGNKVVYSDIKKTVLLK